MSGARGVRAVALSAVAALALLALLVLVVWLRAPAGAEATRRAAEPAAPLEPPTSAPARAPLDANADADASPRRAALPAGSAGPQPTAGPADLPVAVAGATVDAQGSPVPGVSLILSADGGAPVQVVSAENGLFEARLPPARSIEVRAPGGDLEPAWEPEVRTVPFGTRDLVLRRRAQAPQAWVRLRVVAEETGAPLEGAFATYRVRADGVDRARTVGWLGQANAKNRVPILADLEVLVCARDRQDTVARVFAGGLPPADGEVGLDVALARGFRRELLVQHCSERAPIPYARVVHQGEVIGVTGSDGRVVVQLAAWPGHLDVEAAGFETGSWPPNWVDPTGVRGVLLCPLD